MVVVLAVIVVVSLYGAHDSDRVDLTIVQHGEGDVDPDPGEYTIPRGKLVKMYMTPADGWFLADIVVNGKGMPSDVGVLPYGDDGELVMAIGTDTIVEVYFSQGDVQLPEPSRFTFTGDVIEAYADSGMYTVSGGSATDAGTYTAVFSLRSPGYCHWSDGSVDDKSVTWSILPKQVSADDFGSIPGQVYSGVPLEPVLSVVPPMTVDDIQSVVYTDNVLPGTATVQVTTKGNYTGSVTLSFGIARAQVTVSVMDSSKVYGDVDPVFQVDVSGPVGVEPIAYTLVRVQGESVGEYAVAPVGDAVQGNYDVTYVPGTMTVHPRPVVVITGSADKVYDGTPLTKDMGSVSGVLPCDAYTFSVTGTMTDVGEAENWYSLVWSDPGVADNYVVNGVLGTLRACPSSQ